MGEVKMESKLVAEAIGTFALTFIGAGAIIVGSLDGGSTPLLTVAMAHGIVLAVVVSATMSISGGHINPDHGQSLYARNKRRDGQETGHAALHYFPVRDLPR